MRNFFSLVLIILSAALAQAAGEDAVIRIPSHGASATVIDTGKGYTWILGCGHAYQGADRNKPMRFDIPTAHPGPDKRLGSRLVKVDYDADLSLVLLNDGPLDFVAPVAFPGWKEWKHKILSVGYDEMKTPPQKKVANIISESDGRYYTREKPWHGRSGGGLIDTDRGMLVGVVQGYEVPFESNQTRGMYVSLGTIQRFLRSMNPQQQPQQQLQQQFQIPEQWQPRKSAPCPPSG
jgi:hypothetical protein